MRLCCVSESHHLLLLQRHHVTRADARRSRGGQYHDLLCGWRSPSAEVMLAWAAAEPKRRNAVEASLTFLSVQITCMTARI